MPYTERQVRLFQAVEHGFRPTRFKGPSPADASKMLAEVGGRATRPPVRAAALRRRAAGAPA